MKRMGYTICIILSIVLCTSVYANAAEENRPLTELLTESQNAGGLVPELDPSLLPAGLSSLEGKPVLVMLPRVDWQYISELQLEDIAKKTYEDGGAIYIVILEHSTRNIYVRNSTDKSGINVEEIKHIGNSDNLLLDIQKRSTQAFHGTEHTVKNLICLGNTGAGQSRIVYYITDGGVFVRYYTSHSTDEYTLEEFQEKAKIYYDFINSYEFLFDENGKSRGDALSFQAYWTMPTFYREKVRHRSFAERYPYFIPVVCTIVALTVGVVTFCIVRRVKKKNFEATIAALQADTEVDELP